MIGPVRPSDPSHRFEPVYSRSSNGPRFRDQLAQEQASSSFIEWIQSTLRNIRDTLFDSFLSIDLNTEKQRMQQINLSISALEKSGSKKEKAAPIVNDLLPDAKYFVEIGIRKFLQRESRSSAKQYPHAAAFLEDRPHAKEILDLLRSYVTTRLELVDLSNFLPYLRQKTPLPKIFFNFHQLSIPLQTKILLTLVKIDGNSKKVTIEQGDRIMRDPSKLHLFRTAVATAVRGLKMHEEPSLWHREAWRCRFWYS